jgi:tetratricopeptide (TPR) repeat protein
VAEARGELEDARASYERASRLSRIDPEGIWRLAAVEIESGRPEQARAALAELPQRLARVPQAAARLALAERNAGRLDLARVRLKGSFRLYPGATELLLAQADLLEAQGRGAAALEVLRRAQAARPRDLRARLALARGLALAGTDLDLALDLAQASVAQARSADALEGLAFVRSARGEFAEALTLAEEGLGTAPAPARGRLMFRRAEALAGLGRGEDAASALAEARRLAGADPRSKASAARVEKLLSSPRS